MVISSKTTLPPMKNRIICSKQLKKERLHGFNSHGRGDDDESPHHVYIEDDVNVPSSPENFKYPEVIANV